MATTTATITLSSSDLLSDNLSLSATMNLYKGGTTATGLDQMNYHRLVVPTGTHSILSKKVRHYQKMLTTFTL
jgi:hypothetical protein